MSDAAIRRKLVFKGLVRPAHSGKAKPGQVLAVRRTDDRKSTQFVPVYYKRVQGAH